MNVTSRQLNSLNIKNSSNQLNTFDYSQYNMFFLTILFALIILILILMYFSQNFRVNRTLNIMDIYITFQNIQSLKINSLKNYRLCDFYVSSSYNSALSGTQYIDYATTDMIKKILQTGVRFIELQVFGNIYGADAEPIVSSGYAKGEWKLTLNTLYLEDVFKTIRDHAFRIYDGTDGCPNYLDPLFISLDLKTNYNYFVNNKIQKLFSKYLLDYLLDPTYNYQAKNIALVPLKELMGKLIIFSSDGYQGSTLEELVNYSWILPKLKRIHYSELENQSIIQGANGNTTLTNISQQNSTQIDSTKLIIESSQLKQFNSNGLSIVYPHKEGDILTYNFDPEKSWNLGCQFVAMNFQKMDTNMDKYINKFRNKAFILKPQSLRNL
jgi:hypothetical protein